jgi:3-deoxy-D-manno-octulosonate 8-phosphate phosphatase, YrbI family
MNIAFIPVRSGSKSIPLKNIKNLNGKPLVYWVIKAANESKVIDKIYVATDSMEIKGVVESFGVKKVIVAHRSPETATDTASTESAMLEFAQSHQFDIMMLIQATSPLLTADDIDGGFTLFKEKNTDSVLSVVRQKRFIWGKNMNGVAVSQNYDVYNRPRRQEFDGYLVENGAFYITRREDLLRTGNRLSGNIQAYEMSESSYFEIDEPSDWNIIEQLMRKSFSKKNDNRRIKMLLTDCDGVLTDGGMYYSENGDEMKKFSTKDGMAFEILKSRDIITGIITGETRTLIKNRAAKLEVDELYMGVKEKLSIVKKLSEKYGISLCEIAYIGDDINDIKCIEKCGYTACPADAADEIKERTDYICKACGGEGVLREYVNYLINNGNV